MKWDEIKSAEELSAVGIEGEFENNLLRNVRVGGLKIGPGPYGSGIAVYKRARVTRYGVGATVPAAKDQPVYLEFDNETDAQVQANEWRSDAAFANVTVEPRSVLV